MKAAVYYETGAPEALRYEDFEDPTIDPDGVLIQVAAISIEGGDTLNRLGGAMAATPHIVGYQCAGTIAAVGDAVTDRSEGQRHRAGDWANQWLSLRHVFGICYLLGADELAVTIHGALGRAGAVDAFPFEPAAAANFSKEVGDLRHRLGDRRFTAAEQRGCTATTPVVIELIVAQLRTIALSGVPASPPSLP